MMLSGTVVTQIPSNCYVLFMILSIESPIPSDFNQIYLAKKMGSQLR